MTTETQPHQSTAPEARVHERFRQETRTHTCAPRSRGERGQAAAQDLQNQAQSPSCPADLTQHQQLHKQAQPRTNLLDGPSAKITPRIFPGKNNACPQAPTHEDHREAPAPSVDTAAQTHSMHRAPRPSTYPVRTTERHRPSVWTLLPKPAPCTGPPGRHPPREDHHEVHDVPAVPQIGALV